MRTLGVSVGLIGPVIQQRDKTFSCSPAWPTQPVQCLVRVSISVWDAPATQGCCCHPRSQPSFKSKGLLSAARYSVQASVHKLCRPETPVFVLTLNLDCFSQLWHWTLLGAMAPHALGFSCGKLGHSWCRYCSSIMVMMMIMSADGLT